MVVTTYRAKRRLQMAPRVWREPGELVPEAHTWFRMANSLHTGYIVQVQVSEEEFRAAVAEHCPELADRLVDLLGLDGARLIATGVPRRPCTAAQRDWALGLDPGPLVGPVPRLRRGVARQRPGATPVRTAR